MRDVRAKGVKLCLCVCYFVCLFVFVNCWKQFRAVCCQCRVHALQPGEQGARRASRSAIPCSLGANKSIFKLISTMTGRAKCELFVFKTLLNLFLCSWPWPATYTILAQTNSQSPTLSVRVLREHRFDWKWNKRNVPDARAESIFINFSTLVKIFTNWLSKYLRTKPRRPWARMEKICHTVFGNHVCCELCEILRKIRASGTSELYPLLHKHAHNQEIRYTHRKHNFLSSFIGFACLCFWACKERRGDGG